METLQPTASLPRRNGQWKPCNALPHCLGAMGGGTSATQCLTAWGQWAVHLLQCTASLPRGSGQWNFCNALPHCLGAVGGGTSATHCLTAWGQWAAQLLQRTASLPGGNDLLRQRMWDQCCCDGPVGESQNACLKAGARSTFGCRAKMATLWESISKKRQLGQKLHPRRTTVMDRLMVEGAHAV